MINTIIVAVITGVCSVTGAYIAAKSNNDKVKAMIEYRLDVLEKKQDKHNYVIERTYKLEEAYAVLENRTKVSEHRIDDLEKKS